MDSPLYCILRDASSGEMIAVTALELLDDGKLVRDVCRESVEANLWSKDGNPVWLKAKTLYLIRNAFIPLDVSGGPPELPDLRVLTKDWPPTGKMGTEILSTISLISLQQMCPEPTRYIYLIIDCVIIEPIMEERTQKFLDVYGHALIELDKWDSVFTRSSLLIKNSIFVERYVPPKFVNDFEEKVDEMPTVEDDMKALCQSGIYRIRNETMTGNEAMPASPRSAEQAEVMHTRLLTFSSYASPSSFVGKFSSYYLFFAPLRIQTDSNLKFYNSTKPWPLSMILHCESAEINDQLRSYRPKNDFLVTASGFPRLLVEIESCHNDAISLENKIRTILQAAFLVRLASKVDKDFVLVAIFITYHGMAIRYLLYQDQEENGRKVRCKKQEYQLTNGDGRVKFIRQLYGLLHTFSKDDVTLEGEVEKYEELRSVIDIKLLHYTNTRDGSDGGGGATQDEGEGPESFELLEHGYEVKSDSIRWDGGIIMPLGEKPFHIFKVSRFSDEKNTLIAKKLRKNSDELTFLKFLGSLLPSSEHIITLLDSFTTPSGTWAILPKLLCVEDYLESRHDNVRSNVAQIGWGIVEGFAFLHKHCIAHMDIKPSNLLLDKDFCVKIIDFDIAYQLQNEDEKVDDYVGTEGWMAPEVEMRYSPIKADRWGVGNVILYILRVGKGEDETLRTIGQELKVNDPTKRPPLSECLKRRYRQAPSRQRPRTGPYRPTNVDGAQSGETDL